MAPTNALTCARSRTAPSARWKNWTRRATGWPALRAHVDSLHAARIGKQGFVLSLVAAVFLPLGFLTGLFGVNIAGMPGIDWPWAFAALTGVSVALCIALVLYFRWLRWF